MAEAAVYFLTLVLFGFVIMSSALMRHDMLLLACIPPVFVAMVVGFVMALYAVGVFGEVLPAVALSSGAVPGWFVAKRLQSRDLLIAIYLAWAVGMVMASVGFGFPDRV